MIEAGPHSTSVALDRGTATGDEYRGRPWRHRQSRCAHRPSLVSASAGNSRTSELHGMTMREDGVVEMRPFEDGLEIPSHVPLVLESGGIHIMFMGLRERPEDGDRIVVTLVFDRAGLMEVVFPVTRRSSAGIEQDDRT